MQSAGANLSGIALNKHGITVLARTVLQNWNLLFVDAHTNFLSGGTVTEDFDGFFAIIDAHDQYPTTTRKTVLLRPGHNNIVSMGATKVTASPDIASVESHKRFCLFPHEKKLEVHKHYSQANCILECAMRFVESDSNWVSVHVFVLSVFQFWSCFSSY